MKMEEQHEAQEPTLENLTQTPMEPQGKRFFTVKDIMNDLSCSDTYAYKVMREINADLAARGAMTFRGRVLKRAYLAAIDVKK